MEQHGFDRHDRATSIIKELAAAYIQSESNTNPLITVTNVTISPDYKEATIMVTTIPDGKENDALIFLQRKGGEMRGYITKNSRFRSIPHLNFAVDYGERHRQHIDDVVRGIEEEKNEK